MLFLIFISLNFVDYKALANKYIGMSLYVTDSHAG